MQRSCPLTARSYLVPSCWACWHGQVLLTESRFVLPHSLYLTAVQSYRLRPMKEQLYISHELCVRAKRIRDYDFDCQVRFYCASRSAAMVP